jgi:hypothetical protein
VIEPVFYIHLLCLGHRCLVYVFLLAGLSFRVNGCDGMVV